MNNELKNLRQEILDAFENVAPPKDGIIQHECDDCFAMRDSFIGNDWKTLESKTIEDNSGSLLLLTPDAFHYFLPAYLIHSLENLSANNPVFEQTLYAVMPRKKSKGIFKLWRKRFAEFSDDQMYVIEQFLEVVKRHRKKNALFSKKIKKFKRID